MYNYKMWVLPMPVNKSDTVVVLAKIDFGSKKT